MPAPQLNCSSPFPLLVNVLTEAPAAEKVPLRLSLMALVQAIELGAGPRLEQLAHPEGEFRWWLTPTHIDSVKRVCLAHADDQLVGWSAMRSRGYCGIKGQGGYPIPQLLGWFVDPKWRCQGIGHQLAAQMLAEPTTLEAPHTVCTSIDVLEVDCMMLAQGWRAPEGQSSWCYKRWVSPQHPDFPSSSNFPSSPERP